MTLGFWLGAAALSVLALAFIAVPLWLERRRSGSLPPSGPIAAIAILPVAVGLYFAVTTFDPEAARQAHGTSSEDIALLEQLAARLGENPENVDGWMLLGRSYRALGDYERARLAFEEAWTRSDAPDNELKLSLAETMLLTDRRTAQGLAGDLIEEVLADEPDSQAALFYGGIVAVERNDPVGAVERFSALLASNPPADVAEIIREQLIALTGSVPAGATPSERVAGPVIEVEVSVSEEISLERFGPNARLYILARSPEMPMPLAAIQVQQPLQALPGRFSLSDADNPMGTGSLAEHESVVVVARISASGNANAQPGDVYAEAVVRPGSDETVQLVIDQVVTGN